MPTTRRAGYHLAGVVREEVGVPQSLGRPLGRVLPDELAALVGAQGLDPPAVAPAGSDYSTANDRPGRLPAPLVAAHASLITAPEHRTLDSALGWAADELISRFGFDRVMALRMDQNVLRIIRTVFRDHQEWAREAQQNAESYPIELRRDSFETEMLRRCSPALVSPVGDERAWHPIIDQLETRAYVASPVMAFGRVVATLHADSHFRGRTADATDRNVLATFAQVCGWVVERALLFEELARLREAVRANTAQLVALTATEGIDFGPFREAPPVGPSDSKAPLDKAPLGSGPRQLPLTAREIEVLRLMAAGATGNEIARKLVISTGTVKTHARNILRKLGASTRAEAVARYLRG